MIYDEDTQAKAAAPIPALLDTIDKQTAIASEAVRALAERLDRVLAPAEPESVAREQALPSLGGGSNLATRLAQVSSQLGELGLHVNHIAARLEL